MADGSFHTDRLEDHGYFELARRSIPASWGQIVLLAVFVLFTDYRSTNPRLCGLFSTAIVSFNLLRFFLGIHPTRFSRRTWNRLFAPSIWVPAVAWGSLFFSVINSRGLTDYATTVALLIGSGTAAAIITSVSPDRRLALAFVTLMIGIPLVAIVVRMEPKSIGLALIFITYYAFLAFQLNIHHNDFWEGIHNRRRLTEQHNRLEAVMNAIPGLVLWVDEDLRFRGVNRNYAMNYAGSTHEFPGKDLDYKNQDREFLDAVRGFVASPAHHAAQEIRLSVKKAIRWHLLVMRKSAVLPDRTSAETYIVCIDIHDLKEAQSELEQQRLRTELTSKLAALGEITANVAHEIRNPVGLILNSAELINRQLESPPVDNSKLHAHTERIIATCGRINKIIDSLRGFTRKTAGEPYVVTKVGEIIQDSLDLVLPHFRANRVLLEVDSVDHSAAISCQPVEISQVLVNVLSNAVDAAKQQPDKWVRLKVNATQKQVTLSITDSGAGIPEGVAEQIFHPFFTTKSQDAGTGLGLSISRRIMERHGGSVTLDRSAPHTTFVIRLPAANFLRESA